MTKKARIDLIKKLQKARNGTHVITFVTSTRPGFEVQMAMDTVRLFYNHLSKIDSGEATVDLFIHSYGGDGTVPWRLVNIIRENCKEFNVIVPSHAFSAATLTALGADKIIMHPMGALGPTDPVVTNEFNPKDPDSKQPIGISVEEVMAYVDLLKDDVGIRHEDELVIAFNHLADKVHPLALGNVKRSRSQSRHIACKLLGLHMDPKADGHKIDEIVERLTSKSYYHGHPINRKEAKNELNLNIEFPPENVEDLIWKLYLEYEKEMLLSTPFNYIQDFIAAFPNITPDHQEVLNLPKMKAVYVESENFTDVSVVEFQVIGIKKPEGFYNCNLVTIKDSWEKE
jgi:hypothetical protein